VEDDKNKQAGGAAATGLGTCLDGFAPAGTTPGMACAVFDMLVVGSPRLAYALACGIPLVPFDIKCSGLFTDPSVTLVPDVGQNVKIVQDMVVREIKFQIQNQKTPAGLDSITNYFFEQESGIEARLKTVGAGGGYNPVPQFMPLKLIAGPLRTGWLLTYTNGLVMDFQATVPLPFGVQVTVAFKSDTVYWPRLIDMTSEEALKKLKKMGYVCDAFDSNFCQ
jgi:hypothetical protein